MKFLIIFIGLLVAVPSVTNLNQVRDSYRYASESKEKTEAFYELTKNSDYTSNLTLSGYYGCALTLKAAFAEKRGDKISFFKEGRKLIEDAIISEPDNIELRMIRLSVQYNAPRIVRYKGAIDIDKNFILENLDTVSSPKIKEFIKGFIAASAVFK